MKLTRFRIQKYKCIVDSDWVNASSLTVLVGKNESGKTSLLQALHKFNPFEPEPYSIPGEWPRALRGERSDTQVVCTAEFQLDADEVSGLQALAAEPISLDRIQITKDYAGRFEVLFPAGLFPVKLHPNDMDAACVALPKPPPAVGDDFRTAAADCRAEAIRLAYEGRFSDLADLRARQEGRLVVRGPSSPENQSETNFTNSYLQKLEAIGKQLRGGLTAQQKVHDFVVRRLPTFVCMDEYRTFCGTADLDLVKRRRERNDLRPEDETFLTILALAGLDFEKGGSNGDGPREERQYNLSDAEATLNQKIQGHWGQMRYEVEFRADGCQFMTFVRGLKDKALMRLEERSKGFQWFFSFDLMLMHETRGRLRDSVILLDEPGLHLHPEGQLDLLARLAEYAKDNTLIYTTNLPFMIDLEEPDRIRILSETDNGTVVSEDLTRSQPAAKLVLQAALGISGRTSWLAAEQNLLVEGADDYWILNELSGLFRRSHVEGLPPEALMTPAGGASEMTCLAAFMAGQQLEVVALFGNDPAGRTARDKLVKSWLPKCNGQHAKALDLAQACGTPGNECSIDDLFPEPYYLARVQHVFQKQMTTSGVSLSPLPPGNQLAKRVEAAFHARAVPFSKQAVCKRLAADIRQMKHLGELPEQTRRMADRLFATIREAFAKK